MTLTDGIDAAEIARLEKKMARWEKQDVRKAELDAFVLEHGLKCFKCFSTWNEWAATGTSAYGRPWALCVMCMREKWRK